MQSAHERLLLPNMFLTSAPFLFLTSHRMTGLGLGLGFVGRRVRVRVRVRARVRVRVKVRVRVRVRVSVRVRVRIREPSSSDSTMLAMESFVFATVPGSRDKNKKCKELRKPAYRRMVGKPFGEISQVSPDSRLTLVCKQIVR